MRSFITQKQSPTRAFALLLALVVSIPTLWYPFGRDQSLYHYIGREMLHGAVPYRDAFDQKPPLIYVVHAVGIALFGPGQWVIRVFDLLAVALMGWACSRLMDGQLGGGSAGREHLARRSCVAVCVSCTLYYVYFDYWDTAQVEVWEGLFVILGLLAAREVRNGRLAAFLGGACLGTAFLFKFPALLFLPLLAAVTIERVVVTVPRELRWRALAWSAGLQAIAVALPSILAVAGFWARHGLDDALDVLIGYNAFYATHKRIVIESWLATFPLQHDVVPTLLWLLGPLVGWRVARRGGGRFARGAFWVGAAGSLLAVLSVLAQGKLYTYHWGILVPFQTIFCLIGLFSIGDRSERAQLTSLAGMLAVILLLSPVWVHNRSLTWMSYTASWWQQLNGTVSREAFARQFVGTGYSYWPLELIGRVIEERRRPGDELHVHGFEPIPYVISGLRSPSRFFAEFPLFDPKLTYRRDEWTRAHLRALRERPPRFVVDFVYSRKHVAAWLASGYHVLGSVAQFVLLERDRQATAPPPPAP